MPGTKKQHFVPQFYLKRFADTREMIYVFDKLTKRSFLAKVSDIANERYFYDFPINGQDKNQDFPADVDAQIELEGLDEATDPQLVEKAFAGLESTYSPAFAELLEIIEKGCPLSQEQKPLLAHFITMQLLRTRETRNGIVELMETVLNTLAKEAVPEATKNYRIALKKEHAPLEHASIMFDPVLQDKMLYWLLQHIWLIGRNETDSPLYTSDQPVIRKSHRGPGYAGIGSLGIEIVLPVTPKYALILCDRRDFHLMAHLDCTHTALDKENVIHYNSLQIFQSHRYLYSLTGDFGFAVEVCAEHPEVCSTKRIRFERVGLEGSTTTTGKKHGE